MAEKVAKLGKFKIVDFLGLKNLELGSYPHNYITNLIIKYFKKYKPDVVYTHFEHDLNIDHYHTFFSTFIACRPNKDFKIKKFLSFEIPSSTDWGINNNGRLFNPNYFVTLKKADINQIASTGPITTALGGLGLLGGKSAALVGALGGYGIGDIVTQELQRTLGRKGNPNEFAAYENTALRSFTFNWTLLPDNEYESNQIAGLIKFFRKSAHATKGGPLKITVPDECIVSFHGAKDMIQIPPCFIESVNVTYNPNVSSFFRRNNSPVEVGLGVTLKEIVPIYSDDVERGY